MIASVFNGRRAERFARLLDGLDHGGPPQSPAAAHRIDTQLDSLAAIGHRLSGIELGLRTEPEFRTGLRAMLMATIERQGIGATTVDPEPANDGLPARHRRFTQPVLVGSAHRRRSRARPVWYAPIRTRPARGAIMIGIAAGTLAVSGVSVASGDAIPGDTLYGVKRSTEWAQLAFTGSEVGRGQMHLEFARIRTTEAAAVLDNPAGPTNVLNEFDEESRQGIRLLTRASVYRRDPAPLDLVDAFVIAQRQTLVEMQVGIRGAAGTRVDASIALLDEIDRRSTGLRATLACADLGREVDVFGPLPGHCAAPQPPARPKLGSGTPGGAIPGSATPGGQAHPTVPPATTPSASPTASPTAILSKSGLTEPVEEHLPSVLPT